ncbi:MAG: DNA-binding protein [Bacillota bacterium]|nr:DNA-binding protein [Bacillota bacterium]
MREAKSGRILIERLAKGADLLPALTGICVREGITHGEVWAIGALARARVAYYDQTARRYKTLDIPEPCEIVSLVGNISLKDGEPFVHAHLAVGDEKGHVFGGHLVEGCEVFAAEYVIREYLVAAHLERTYDEPTGLALWKSEAGCQRSEQR